MYQATRLMLSDSPSPDQINWLFFAYQLTYFPTLALTNTVAMKNIPSVEKDFPSIRVLGTIGWIAAGLVLTWAGIEKTVSMFYLSSGAAAALGLYSFLLPDTPPVKDGKVTFREILGLDALVLLKDRAYLTFILASTLICIPLAFYYQLASRVVELVDLPIGQTMSYGQMSEIFFMLVMPFFFARLGIKKMLAVGMLAWVARYALFAMGAPDEIRWMILAGVILHGICYDFFFVTGQIYTDRVAAKPIRAQAQGLLVFFTLGLGMAVGAKIAGYYEARHTTSESTAFKKQVEAKGKEIETLKKTLGDNPSISDKNALEKLGKEKAAFRHSELEAIEWNSLWAAPAMMAGAVLVIFFLIFREPDTADGKRSSDEKTA